MGKFRDVFVIDALFDHSRNQGEDNRGPRHFANQMRRRGKTVHTILAVCVSHAVLEIVHNIEKHQARKMPIRALRFYGHGAEGRQIVGGNSNGTDPAQVLEMNGGYLRHRGELALIKPLLDPRKSRVELHGCRVGAGESGAVFLRRLADHLNVPVLAGGSSQYSLTSMNALGFEGTVSVAIPGRSRIAKIIMVDASLD